MFNHCCVEYCGSRRKDMNFYRFPKSEIMCRKWLDCINSDSLRTLNIQDLRKQFVCRKHFEKKFFTSSGQRSRLRSDAYPTIYNHSTRIIMPDEANNVNHDHNYVKKRRHMDHTYCQPQVANKRRRIESEMCTMPSTSYVEKVIKEKPTGSSIHSVWKTQRHGVLVKKRHTPLTLKISREYNLSKKQDNFKNRAKRAIKFSRHLNIIKCLEKLNPLAQKFLWMQISQCKKKARGRRFTDDEKLLAMSIMKQSPKCYKFLQKIFILPSKYTLNKMITNLNVEAGINEQIFEAVKQEVDTWDEKKKICSILFDEVSLEPAIIYDNHKDVINGFVDLNGKNCEFADHALVFMLRGAIHKWQQPIAYYFCKGATSATYLKNIIKEMVTAVMNTGLLPIALVCDQGTSFQSALKSLQQDAYREQIKIGEKIDDVIIINGHTLSIVYDPPHLLKGIRNNFLTKNIELNGNISTWQDIVEVYKTDCHHAEMRLLHKLNDEHVIPEKIKKMKVKNATRVFSKTMAATLSYSAQFSHYADGQPVSATLKNTADIVSFLDDLFDSVNGANTRNRGKPLRRVVTDKSPHVAFWEEAIKKIKTLKFVDNVGKRVSVPSLKNWMTTLKSYQRLWQYLNSKNINIMRPRFFNSDPIENFFGQMRAYNFRNNNLNCHTFKSTFKSLLITRFIKFHSETFNCEEDSGEQLLKVKSLFNIINTTKQSNNPVNIDSLESSGSQNMSENILTSAKLERLHVHSRAFTTGWVVRKILKKIDCKKCKDNLTCKESNYGSDSINNWISCKEFKNMKNPRKLTYPSEYAVRFFKNITLESNKYLETKPHLERIIGNLKNIIKSKYLFESLECHIHKDMVLEYFLDLTLRLTVFNWCNTINKILKGTDIFRLQNKELPNMQMKAYKKYLTRLRNKTGRK